MKEEWDKKAAHPMQGFEWGEFKKRMGNKVSRIVGENQYQIVWSRVFGDVWFGYCPMSPMPTEKDLKIIKGGIGVRFEPNELEGIKAPKILVPGRHLFKQKTYWLDLTLSEEALLGKMTPKCRYNIRLAQKHNVVIKEGGVDSYVSLLNRTAKRQKIYTHSEKYHRELARLDFVNIFEAVWNGKIIASWMIFSWKDFIYYAYGAFDDEYKNLMAPVLGLWEIIKWGKRQGFKKFDLWGAEESRGFSRFKEQFGPVLVEMAGTYDLPSSFLYPLFRLAEEVRWKVLRAVK